MKKPKGCSLHIGLNSVDPNHYAGWSGPLAACEADAEDMERMARKKRFRTTLLKTGEADRETVKGVIHEAATSLSKGDIFFLSYSGHGGQVPDMDAEEPDLQDETWCLYDGELIDDELYALWGGFSAGVRILVLSDSCHSGTVTKLAFDPMSGSSPAARSVAAAYGVAQAKYRVMPDDVALRTYRKNRRFYDRLAAAIPKERRRPKAAVRLISGCQDNQLSLDGTFNGLFTGMLLRVWNDGKFKGNYADFHNAILRRMPPTQSPNHYVIGPHNPTYDAQKPFTI